MKQRIRLESNVSRVAHSMAIIVPLRDREDHLTTFVHFMEAYFRRLEISYRIYVIEQVDDHMFSRGSLMNVGFMLSENESDYFAFHDVDLLPALPDIDYSYPFEGARHTCLCYQKDGWKPKYDNQFGGVTLMTREDFLAVNGFPLFFGWGGEDDSLYMRTKLAGINITRDADACYWSLHHDGNHPVYKDDKDRPDWYVEILSRLGHTHETWKTDGLSSLRYDVLSRDVYPLYVRYKVALHR